MNLHVPQSIVTEHELRAIAAVPYQIMSPKECKPLVAVVQDVALGIYRLTKKHVMLNEKQLFNLMSTNSRFIGELPAPVVDRNDIKRWSGQQALSAIIPANVNLRSANKSYDERIDDKDNFVIIENGTIKNGVIDKDIYQKRTKGLIHSIYNDAGEDETRHFFDNTQKLICNWLVYSGFSVGISDLIVDDSTQQNLKSTINQMKVQVYDIIRDIHLNKFENLSINDNNEYFETEINKILNKAREQTGKLGLSKINDVENRMINMIKSGAKGSSMNVAQMIACVGQQNVDGKRIAYGFDHRTLPHFVKYDDGPDSRGFVENSFISGLTPQEFFFHSMGGREGLIDTAVKTSETGYLQRKLVKAMEDCKISYDYTVRNASGSIIQFLYGEDGMNPIKIESQHLPYINHTLDQLHKEYMLTSVDIEDCLLLHPSVVQDLKSDKTWEQAMRKHFDQVLEDRRYMIVEVFKRKQESTFMYPVSFTRIINNAKAMLKKYGMVALSDLNPMYVLKSIDALCKELYVSANNPGNQFLHILIRCHLSPKQVMYNYRFTKDVFDHVLQEIKLRFHEAIASPSEMVGVVAAQSIGEPATQLTLNSVEWNTELLIKVKDSLERVKIGEFIDAIASTANEDTIEHHPNDTTLVWIKEREVQILSCDEDGNVRWEMVEAVTKHPPMNKDGSNTLLNVKLQSGRSVIATKAKSFLKRQNNKIIEINGDELRIGDYIPVSSILPVPDDVTMKHLDLMTYLPPSEFLYMSEVEKAVSAQKSGGAWWKDGQNNRFTVPYSSSDAFTHTFIHKHNSQTFQDGCVYPKKCKNTTSIIPEKLSLDEDFGFLVGAYAAEGCSTPQHLLISNNNMDFNAKIDAFAQRYKIGYHVDKTITKAGTSTTVRMHSTVLSQLMSRIVGKGSSNKRLPAWVFQAPTSFVKGLVNGYFSEDGTVAKEPRNVISATSTSYGLMEDMRQLLVKFGIQSTICVHDTPKYESKRQRFATTQVAYKLSISCGNTSRFADIFTLCINNKQERLDTLRNKPYMFARAMCDIVPDIVTKTYGTISCHRDKLPELLKDTVLCEEDRIIIQNVMNENVMYDKVIAIEEFVSEHAYVYDLTVSNTKNFNVYNGIAMRDTFHHSGISSASKAVRGVPRIKELLSVTKNIKSPSMVITLQDDIKRDKMASNKVLKSIQTTLFRDIVTSSRIYFDPEDFDTGIEEDRPFIETYRELASHSLFEPPSVSPWLLRIEIDRQKLLDEGLTMLTLYSTLSEYYGDTIACMFSDDNSGNLVFRIKIADEGAQDDEKDYITELKALEKNIMDNTIIKGIKNIQKAIMTKQEASMYNEDTMEFEKESEWVISTSGTNMVDVMSHPGIDYTQTVSNDINEIYDLLGIEAARQALYNELFAVIDSAELYVNYRHLALLVDTMTNRGYMLSIDRHGINRVDFGPLAKCSFEETTDMLIKAGIFAEVDRINGVSANIMLGQIPPCGTGDCDVLIDEHKLLDILQEDEDEDSGAPEIGEDEDQGHCTLERLTFDFNIDSVPKTRTIALKDVEIKIV